MPGVDCEGNTHKSSMVRQSFCPLMAAALLINTSKLPPVISATLAAAACTYPLAVLLHSDSNHGHPYAPLMPCDQ